MSSLFSETTIETINKIKKVFLWTAVCILIGEVVVGAILILAQSFNETIGKLMGTFALCGLMLFLGVNNFSMMKDDDRIVQSFALTSLIGNIVWLVISVLFIWGSFDFMERGGSFGYHLSAMAKLLMISINIALMSFLISNVWSIEETLKPVRPLKITAIICALYCGIYAVVTTLGEVTVNDMRWYALAGLAGSAFVVMAIAAHIVSKSGKKKNAKEANDMSAEITQAKIQEMVEKEVQARMAAQNIQDVGAVQEPTVTEKPEVAQESEAKHQSEDQQEAETTDTDNDLGQ